VEARAAGPERDARNCLSRLTVEAARAEVKGGRAHQKFMTGMSRPKDMKMRGGRCTWKDVHVRDVSSGDIH
jgi:hypothetical protein